jgi:hypothetical protein
MKIGALEIYWHPGGFSVHATIAATMRTHPPFRALLAKIARAEVKNYMAELAEDAEMPFIGPAEFLRIVRSETTKTATTGSPEDPANDAPYKMKADNP